MNHEQHMHRALRLAAKGRGKTSPNPMVGAVLVKDGRIVGEGWHHQAGAPHAEAEAIGQATQDARGATLYVNLEPCVHYGKTPPCTDLIIQKGIRRVVCAIEDPNPAVSGQGIAKLRAAGVEAVCDVLAEKAEHLNRAYLKHTRTGLPYVTLKLAQSLDGKIATKSGVSRWITGDAARKWVHRLRAQADAVLVGANTVLADDPHLTARLPKAADPIRIVLDSRLRVPASAKVFDAGRVIVVITPLASPSRRNELARRGVELWEFDDIHGPEGITKVLTKTGAHQITNLLVEGGAQVAASLLKAGLVDSLAVLIAPKLIGDGLSSIADLGVEELSGAVPLSDVKLRRLGEDILYQCRLGHRRSPA